MLDACWSEQGKINGTEFEVLFDTPSQGLKNAECKRVILWMLERPGKLVQWMIEVVLAEDVGCIFSVCPCSILVGRKTWLEPRNEDDVHHKLLESLAEPSHSIFLEHLQIEDSRDVSRSKQIWRCSFVSA